MPVSICMFLQGLLRLEERNGLLGVYLFGIIADYYQRYLWTRVHDHA